MLKYNTFLQNGKYQILETLGQGGFGITYLAKDLQLGRKVAIKELFIKGLCWRNDNQDVVYNPENHELFSRLHHRFLKEARHLAMVSNPYIIHIHDFFEEKCTAYYVMDYLEGENLFDYVKRNGPMSVEEALSVIQQTADALKYIHDIQMSHLDIKPSNLMLVKESNKVILIDFGLSMQYDVNHNVTTMLPAISNGFSAVEMYNQSGFNSFSPQADIYSLGATLYFLITGSVPPSALDIAAGNKSISMDSIPSSIKDVIIESMKVSKTARPQTIADFLTLLPTNDKIKDTKKPYHNHNELNIVEKTELLSSKDKDYQKSNKFDNTLNKETVEVAVPSQKNKSSIIKTLVFLIIAIGIIIGFLIMGGYIVFWDNIAPLQLGVFE